MSIIGCLSVVLYIAMFFAYRKVVSTQVTPGSANDQQILVQRRLAVTLGMIVVCTLILFILPSTVVAVSGFLNINLPAPVISAIGSLTRISTIVDIGIYIFRQKEIRSGMWNILRCKNAQSSVTIQVGRQSAMLSPLTFSPHWSQYSSMKQFVSPLCSFLSSNSFLGNYVFVFSSKLCFLFCKASIIFKKNFLWSQSILVNLLCLLCVSVSFLVMYTKTNIKHKQRGLLHRTIKIKGNWRFHKTRILKIIQAANYAICALQQKKRCYQKRSRGNICQLAIRKFFAIIYYFFPALVSIFKIKSISFQKRVQRELWPIALVRLNQSFLFLIAPHDRNSRKFFLTCSLHKSSK